MPGIYEFSRTISIHRNEWINEWPVKPTRAMQSKWPVRQISVRYLGKPDRGGLATIRCGLLGSKWVLCLGGDDGGVKMSVRYILLFYLAWEPTSVISLMPNPSVKWSFGTNIATLGRDAWKTRVSIKSIPRGNKYWSSPRNIYIALLTF